MGPKAAFAQGVLDSPGALPGPPGLEVVDRQRLDVGQLECFQVTGQSLGLIVGEGDFDGK